MLWMTSKVFVWCVLHKGQKRSFVADWYDFKNITAVGRGLFRFLSPEASVGIDPIKAEYIVPFVEELKSLQL